MSSLVSLRKH